MLNPGIKIPGILETQIGCIVPIIPRSWKEDASQSPLERNSIIRRHRKNERPELVIANWYLRLTIQKLNNRDGA